MLIIIKLKKKIYSCSRYTHWNQTVFFLDEYFACELDDVVTGDFKVKVEEGVKVEILVSV